MARAAALLAAALLPACDASAPGSAAASPSAGPPSAPAALSDSAFAALHRRISEPGGFFDTDNLISNESGYLNVVGALERLGLEGGAYAGVGPDQNFSYIAHLRPELAFIVDIRRDNVLHHLLLKALMEASPTRVEFLSALHGRPPPPDPERWADADIADIVDWVDGRPADPDVVARLDAEVERAVAGYGIALSAADLATVRRFHHAFIDAGPGLRFTSFGRPPRPYYPTYRQLVLETDAEGRRASYLATRAWYDTVRALQLANRIIPVVGDLAGSTALREMGAVLQEEGLELTAFYTSNVEFYLWRGRTLGRWFDNLAALPARDDAVIIRSYFPNFGGRHPSALPGYYATQTLQPVRTVVEGARGGGFDGYLDLVTRDVLELREPAGVR